jgi:hypothetical protein
MELDAPQVTFLWRMWPTTPQKEAFLWHMELHAPQKIFQPSTHPPLVDRLFSVQKITENYKNFKKESFELYLY